MTSIDSPLRTIRVYGTLAKVLKRRTLKAVVSSPRDAIRFLLVNFPEVQQYLKPRFFRISMGSYCINEHELNYPAGSDEEIHIVPAICGAGAVGNIIAGVILITASIFFPFLAPVLLPLGIGLTLLGIGQLLTPVPTIGDSQSNPRDSFNFSGIQQTSREGPPVPVVYGEIFTGSIVLSVGFEEADDELDPDYSEEAAGDTPGSTGPKFTTPPFNPNDPVSECSYEEPDPVIVVDNPYGQSRVRVWWGEESFKSYRELCDCDTFAYIAGERTIYLRKEQSSTSMQGVETFTAGLLQSRYVCSPNDFYCYEAPCGSVVGPLDQSVFNLEIAFIRPNGTKLIAQSNNRTSGDFCGFSQLTSYGGTQNNHTYTWIAAIEAENPENGEWTVLYANPSPLLPGWPQFIEGEIYNEVSIVDVSGDWSNAPVPFPNT